MNKSEDKPSPERSPPNREREFQQRETRGGFSSCYGPEKLKPGGEGG
ncbi:hypothetical protein [Phormidium sp. CCY1219]|nr:hypothetical protein [Phormidium sp. CCY1219]MEB3830310.1 hypothetical protein [Phormidium sp. CCY1219]